MTDDATEDAPAFDFQRHCRPGMVLKTRDRREARIIEVEPGTGVITGTVQMLGRCQWRADGRYMLAPADAAGPWDLMPPHQAESSKPRRHESLVDALDSGDGNPGCCD